MAHIPVLLHEVLEILDIRPQSFVIDGTVNGGGHARAMLSKLGERGQLLGLDLDPTSVTELSREMGNERRVEIIHGNYADLPRLLAGRNPPTADGILLDLGFSTNQLEGMERGFSFGRDEPLRMTYDPTQEPVRDILKRITEDELSEILFSLGGEKMRKRIAHGIKSAVRRKGIETSGELADVVRTLVPKNYERGRIDPATRTFQALRIFANRELENLKTFLAEIPRILSPGGRVAIISFHSLEDKLTKIFFRDYEKSGVAKQLTKKPITPSREEVESNPRSRSAKLRGLMLADEIKT